jgi:hypothetical protein
MADYYPLILRAVNGLSDKAPEQRHVLYERARAALIPQLQSLDPPLAAAEITRERLALDEAIDRVEAEYALGEASFEPPPLPEPPAPVAPPPGPPARIRPEAPPDPVVERYFGSAAIEEEPQPRERPRIDTVSRVIADQGRGRMIVLAGVIVLVVALIGVAAWLLRVQPSELEQAGQEAPKAQAEAPEVPERVPSELEQAGQEAPKAQAEASEMPERVTDRLPGAQRALLYEENPAEPKNPKATRGRALWRVEALNPGQGQALEMVVRANVEVSGAGLSLALALRRNADPALPASHIIELTFTTPDDPGRVVRDVGLPQFKAEEAVRGTPLAGLPVPVKDNVFLIGLSNLPSDMDRNQDLMLRRNWIDLPIRFASGQRAILSFEKGVTDDQGINDAVRHWQAQPR